MSQKVKKQKEEQYFMDPFFETLWNQYEGSLSRSRQRREERLRGFVNTLNETTKFNEEYRETLKGFFGEVKKLNNKFSLESFRNKAVKTEEFSDAEAINKQVGETESKLEKLLLTPFKSSFDMIDRAEKSLKKNSESYIEFVIERSNEWSAVTDNYLKQARLSHQNINHRLEDSLRTLITPSK